MARLRAIVHDVIRVTAEHFKTPHRVTFLTELPKTATGKIQKYVLRAGRAGISAQ